MCMNIEIAPIIFEICIVPEPATTSGTGLLLDRDTGHAARIVQVTERYITRVVWNRGCVMTLYLSSKWSAVDHSCYCVSQH